MTKRPACDLGHRIRMTIAVDGVELAAYRCCDSRECLFKSVEGGVMVCRYDDPPHDGRGLPENTEDKHSNREGTQ